MPLLESKELTKRFGALVAVDGVNLTIDEGKIHSIIGANGAGKTTLFNLLAGVITPTRGDIIYRGEDITSLSIHERCRKGIGRSFQITSIFPALTVRENVRIAVQSKSRKRFNIFRRAIDLEDIENRTTAILDQFKLIEYEKKKADTIPYGSQRILEIAITVATEPILLFLDEPTSGMSPEDITDMIRLIKDISEKYTTVVIEHHMHVVMSISDKITVLHLGKIIAEGTPEYVKSHNEVMRAYLGEKEFERMQDY